MKVALYLRVSTDKQETENQAVQLREFAGKQGWQVVREYTDYESGAKAERTQLKQMFDDASRRKFDLVLFWALDRLSREGVYHTLQHLNRLESYGVGFRSFTEPTSTPVGCSKMQSLPSWLLWRSRSESSDQSAPKRVWLALGRRDSGSGGHSWRSKRQKWLASAMLGYLDAPSLVTLAYPRERCAV